MVEIGGESNPTTGGQATDDADRLEKARERGRRAAVATVTDDGEAATAATDGHVSPAALKLAARQPKSLNAAAGTRVVSNEDVVRLSLLTLGVFQELSQEGSDPLTEETADVVMPLMDHIRDAADPDVLRRHLENTEVNEGGRE